MNVKEENRILKVRAENLNLAAEGRYRKYKKKSQKDLQDIVKKDPIMNYNLDEDNDMIIFKIIQYRNKPYRKIRRKFIHYF